ncbi:mitochondrial ribosomal protein S7 [Halictus rubicundus]|uniref:mitochondrial ribosomal protein S7 n=1 Tax=Halictus rubicundus TaxID=77578 RepID=UPI004036BBC1
MKPPLLFCEFCCESAGTVFCTKMALARSLNPLLLQNIKRYTPTNIIQNYSLYPSTYIKPVYKKEDQNQLNKSEEREKVAHLPIRAALTSDTASEFHDEVVRKFTNYIMRKGKKAVARAIVEKTFEHIKMIQLERYNKTAPEHKQFVLLNPIDIFHRAIENCTPMLQLQKIRKGGIVYQVPVPMNDNRARFLSMNWIIQTASEKDCTQTFPSMLAKELIDAANHQGRVIKRKQDIHKQCEANRAYAHFRWI